MANPYQWSLYIGPAWERYDSPYYRSWSNYLLGVASLLDYQSTLTSTLASGATSLTVVSAANFPTQSGVWVAPNGAGQAWEYIRYSGKATNTLTGLVREPTATREHNGIHTSGAVARTWWKVAQNDGNLHIGLSLDEMLVSNDWQVEIAGIAAPQAALQPFHIAIIQARAAVSGSLLNTFVGFLDTTTIRDDKQRARNWRARIGSVALLLDRVEVQGVRVGEYDLAEHGSASSSVPLGAAHKERFVGDFVAANPSFDPNNVLDEDNDSLWIGDRIIGTDEIPTGYEGFTQIYIAPPVTINAGAKWLEIIGRDTASVDLVAWDTVAGVERILDIRSETLGAGDRYIIAENEVVFTKENPSQQAFSIFDVSGHDNPGWFNYLKPEGGAIAFRMMGANYSGAIYWGSVTPATTGWSPDGWTGPSLAAPQADQTMRYLMNSSPATNTRDRWEVSRRQSPGYNIEDNNRGEQAWLAVELPSMGLILHDDITATVPGVGATLYIDGQNGPSNDGLPPDGWLAIGQEAISFSAKTKGGVIVSGRGALGSVAADHVAGDAVLMFFTQGGRTMVTDALPLKALSWQRWGGTVYPSDFKWRYTALEARTPDQEQHEDDYEVLNTFTGQTGASHSLTLSNNRAKTILIEFNRMTGNAARPRLNRIKAIVDPFFFDAAQWLSEGQTIEALMEQIGINAGIGTENILVVAGGAAPQGFTTAIDSAWAVMASAAEMGGSYIQVARDSQMTVRPDTLWTTPFGSLPVSKTWTRSNASNVEFVRSAGGQASQVKLHWETPDGSASGIAIYPATPDKLGRVAEVGPRYFATADAAQAAAQRQYVISRYPVEIMVTLAAGDMSIMPREIHRVQWQLANDMQSINRTILVRSVQHSVSDSMLGTVIQGIQLDRESDG